jgi:hypothetical protein
MADTPYERIVEAMARAICEATGLNWDDQASAQTSGGGSDEEQDGYREQAQAALTAALPMIAEVAGDVEIEAPLAPGVADGAVLARRKIIATILALNPENTP